MRAQFIDLNFSKPFYNFSSLSFYHIQTIMLISHHILTMLFYKKKQNIVKRNLKSCETRSNSFLVTQTSTSLSSHLFPSSFYSFLEFLSLFFWLTNKSFILLYFHIPHLYIHFTYAYSYSWRYIYVSNTQIRFYEFDNIDYILE